MGSQVLSSRLRMPALIILLPAGFTAGALTTDVNPNRLLGAAFQPLVAESGRSLCSRSLTKLVRRVTGVHPRNMPSDDPAGEDWRLAQDRGWAEWALRRWELFPVSEQPRALVMSGPMTRFERGFQSAEAKLAFLYGDIESAVPLPDGLLAVLRANGPEPWPGQKGWSRPLLITEANAVSAEFGTDRGRREFPAWRLGGPEVDGAFWVLDPAIAATRWQPPEPAPPKPFDGEPHRGGSAVLEGDDRTLHFSFTGGEPAFFEYPSAQVIETDQAVVVLPVERYVGPPGPGWLAMRGFGRTVKIGLSRPLGERVIVDFDASPVPVATAVQGSQRSWAESAFGTD
ncbi:MAG: hypothetical protein ACTHKL_15370 [Streptosporangiaceae bacterium]